MRGYILAISCLMVVALSTAFTAWVMESVINETFANKRTDLVWIICISIFVAFSLKGLASYGQAVALTKIGNAIVARYQKRLFNHLLALNLGYFSEARSARITATISQNVNGIRDTLNLTITSLARDALTFVALVGVMFSKDPLLSVIVFLAAPPMFIAMRIIARKIRVASRESVEYNAHVSGAMQEAIQGLPIVKAFTMESQLRGRVEHLVDTAERRANRIARLSERTAPLTESFAGAAIALVLGYAAYQSIYNGQLPGAFIAFITALLLAYDPARRLTKLQVQMERAYVNAKMIYDILDTPIPMRDVAEAKPLEVTAGKIEFRNVHFGYGADPILKGVSFVAQGGETTAFAGPSGAGKSTIINLIPRFYDPDQGQILIDGQDLRFVTKQSLREKLAYVSQAPVLFEGTVRDNIRYGRPDATDREIEDAARLAYAHEFILNLPLGYDTPVGENGANLSGGQKQRLSIARALVRNAPILLLDEATSALDNESEAAVQKAFENAMKGRTVVVIAHRLSTIAEADKIIVIEAGQIAEEGSHDMLAREEGGLYARLNRLQIRKDDISSMGTGQ
ncbi:ABC transporter ATP-binding protein [Rhizobium sp. KVB221]|uniref:ABC transporter ATP-binding protein n=2 Tax=Rhizobium setariae TaxID=2801340 RepID=A0A936YJ25_9HYPH|nr:ABC transporter ATP-binding protein [Rhizobium setariae]MBL0370518.1 ABC transporter ATP-binding protein [Rhizobium setariae]